MRGIDQITKELASEREERDYTEGRIAVWSRELADMAPTAHGRTRIVRRLSDLEIKLAEAEKNIRLLKTERDAALAAA